MENRQRVLVIVLVGVLAVVGGFAVGAVFTGRGTTAGQTASPVAQASVPAEPGSAEPTTTADGSQDASASDAASPTPSPTASPKPRATVTFTGLGLDAKDDPAGQDRILRFVSGTGSITVELKSLTPQGNTRFCLSTLTKELGCRTAGSGRLSAKTTKPKETFLVTLRGEAIAQPVVEVKLTFPAKAPSVIIENARFDGTDYPATNGIKAKFTPMAEGKVHIKAAWGGHPFQYQIDLSQTGQPGVTTYAPDEGDIGTDQSFPVQPGSPWVIVLRNTESGFGITPMTATLSWP